MNPNRHALGRISLDRVESRNGGILQRWVARTPGGSVLSMGRNREHVYRGALKTIASGVYLMDFDSIEWKVRTEFGAAS